MKRLMAWAILINAISVILIFLIFIVVWVSTIINAPICDGTAQPVCRIRGDNK